mgnify:CR=1 FL=1
MKNIPIYDENDYETIQTEYENYLYGESPIFVGNFVNRLREEREWSELDNLPIRYDVGVKII